MRNFLEFIVGVLIFYALPFLYKAVFFPVRVICLFVGHNDYYQGGGFLFSPKYDLYCDRCKRERDINEDEWEKGVKIK